MFFTNAKSALTLCNILTRSANSIVKSPSNLALYARIQTCSFSFVVLSESDWDWYTVGSLNTTDENESEDDDAVEHETDLDIIGDV